MCKEIVIRVLCCVFCLCGMYLGCFDKGVIESDLLFYFFLFKFVRNNKMCIVLVRFDYVKLVVSFCFKS